MRRWARERQEKRENSQSISKRLCAALMRLFAGQHDGKMDCMRGVPVVTGTLGNANSHFDPTQTGSGTAHLVEAAVDWCRILIVIVLVVQLLN